MILPTKHLPPEKALVSIGAEILDGLHTPKTVSRLWEEHRSARSRSSTRKPTTYEWFILALDLLFLMGAVQIKNGVIEKDQ